MITHTLLEVIDMSISQVAPNSTVATPVPVKPQTTPNAQTPNAQPSQAAEAAPPAKAVTVTISKQAVIMNSPGYSPVEEAQESAAVKAVEKQKGQR
jgi:hypothetical protein